jgi:Transposase DDE domain
MRCVLSCCGGVWHKRDREAGIVPYTSIDTETHWTKSDWHGWVYGWKLHLVTTVAGVWIPLAADLTAANVADNAQALTLLPELPAEVRYVLGDQHYHDPAIDAACAQAGQTLVATRRGPYPHTDDGVGVRRLLHELRSRAIENLNEQFKGIFDAHGQVPTKGLVNTRRFALGAVFVYQLTLWYRHEHGLALRVGLKACLKAA